MYAFGKRVVVHGVAVVRTEMWSRSPSPGRSGVTSNSQLVELQPRTRILGVLATVTVGAMVLFGYRRLDHGEWEFGEPVVAVLIVLVLLLPGLAVLVGAVRDARLFAIGMLCMVASLLAGFLLAAAEGGDGQAGVNLLATPVLSGLSAGGLALLQRARSTGE